MDAKEQASRDRRERTHQRWLQAIEEKMREIIRADKPLRREVWSRQQLIDKWQAEGETFKAEWAQELPEGEELTVYWSGDDWLDMCRGPHLPSTGKLDPQAFKLMQTQQPMGGRIVNNGSISAHAPRPGSIAYTATKTAILGMTRAMALNHAADGIRVNAVCPGPTETPMLHDSWTKMFPGTPSSETLAATSGWAPAMPVLAM